MFVMLLKPKESESVERSIQLNPNNDAYWQARGYAKRPDNWKQLIAQAKSKGGGKSAPAKKPKKGDSQQVNNPNNDAYWQARGYAKRPDNWKQLAAQAKSKSKGGGKSAPNRKKKKRGVERTPHGTELRGRIGPLEWDDWGLLPADGFGRLSADDY